ncbi:Transcriptional regulator containing PAS, AAA-type ATPase, and DNA-binding Fis domains [Solimonas aquatica]|uniref:Transcriptional regulator containing PAS, AAA-type ATPase, and DNA-binding Fis domains n=1 Tax=Solimonas aquatica TaxID=489703 RepID=A0A1H9BK58_9GAMM|nr:sigma-54-dependent Fis family transcriptional regulator [Solimonas aquatica]SEP89384.1 Transcriptional regulator containing PAS, AAA-type ATPase, and DNA-binding Fis domains [Solimonas aquatica]
MKQEMPLKGLQRGTGEAYDRLQREDLLSRLRFAPEAGHIWLDGKRMFLLHTGAFGTLRQELIETVGPAEARGILTRMGYQSGARDAELAKKVRSDLSYFERFCVGPQLHALEGIVLVEAVKVEVDVERGHHYGEFVWHESVEDEAHIMAYGIGTEPVCWMQIGYASGYASAFMGRSILYREVSCRATGDSACRIIGKPLEQWQDAEEDVSYFRAQGFVNRTVVDFGATQSREAATRNERGAGSQGRHRDARMLIGASAGFNIVCHAIKRVAPTDAPVLILGESGVGKEMFARALHGESSRSDKPFIAVNCAAIPEQLIESELFGVEKGAFTGAVSSRPGRFERANGGTLFLDELGCLSLPAQSKLLRAVQEGEIERVGDTKQRQVDVRIIAATNEDLRDAVERKTFREDLFYRLNVYPVQIPPLRERTEDIYLLMEYFLDRLTKRHRRDVSGFTDRAIDALLAHDWPGNVRELENVIERAVILASDGGSIDVYHLPEIVARSKRRGLMNPSISGQLVDCEELPLRESAANTAAITDLSVRDNLSEEVPAPDLIFAALERHRGNLSAAARELGLTRAQIAYRAEKLGYAGLFRRRS